MFSRTVGIDIGSTSIKLVELAGRGSRSLKSIGFEPLPAGAVQDGIIQQPETVAQHLKGLIKRLRIVPLGKRAAISLGGSAVVIKRIDIDTSQGDFDDQVNHEAEQHFGDDLADMHFRYTKMATAQQSGLVPVVMVGVRHEFIMQHVNTIHAANLKVGVIDCDAFCLFNMYEHNYGVPSHLVAQINVGAHMTQIALAWQGIHLYSRDVSIGSEHYSKHLATSLGVDIKEAQTIKIKASTGDSVPKEALKAISEINEQLIGEINMTFEYYFQSGEAPPGSSIGEIAMVGGGSRCSGLDAALAATFQVPVNLINPFHQIATNAKQENEIIKDKGHHFGVAVGLGLRHMGDAKG